jgi:hypothetical protein
VSEFKVWPFVPAVDVEPDPEWAGKVFQFQEMRLDVHPDECDHDWQLVDCVVASDGREVGRFDPPIDACPKCRAMRAHDE